jgi:hypothetical protein
MIEEEHLQPLPGMSQAFFICIEHRKIVHNGIAKPAYSGANPAKLRRYK